MSSRVATLKRGIVLASAVVSSYAVFGQDAWAPQPAYVAQNLDQYNTTAAAYHYPSGQPTTVRRWPSGWTLGALESGTPCSPVDIPAGTLVYWVIERYGNYSRCTSWPTEGARLTAGLSGTGSAAPATTLVEADARDVVQFPANWTYNTTLAAGTYCAPWSAPAGTAVGTVIVRSGDYAKCSY
jgi:hypothetical protein